MPGTPLSAEGQSVLKLINMTLASCKWVAWKDMDPHDKQFIFTSRPSLSSESDVTKMLQSTFNLQSRTGTLLIGKTTEICEGGLVDGSIMVFASVIDECHIEAGDLDIDLDLAKKNPNLNNLWAAYKFVFDRASKGVRVDGNASGSRQGGTERDKIRYEHLLAVLVAANESLSLFFLQQMNLASQREDLPGWGSLFYEANGRIFVSSRLLTSWLTDKRLNEKHYVDSDLGRRLLGEFYIASLGQHNTMYGN